MVRTATRNWKDKTLTCLYFQLSEMPDLRELTVVWRGNEMLSEDKVWWARIFGRWTGFIGRLEPGIRTADGGFQVELCMRKRMGGGLQDLSGVFVDDEEGVIGAEEKSRLAILWDHFCESREHGLLGQVDG